MGIYHSGEKGYAIVLKKIVKARSSSASPSSQALSVCNKLIEIHIIILYNDRGVVTN